jgi:hypothetical protein
MYERLSVRTVLATAFLFTMVGAGCGASSHNASSAGAGQQAAAAAAAKSAATTTPAAAAAVDASASGSSGGSVSGAGPCDFMKRDPISKVGDATSFSQGASELRAEASYVKAHWPSALHDDAETVAKVLDKLAGDVEHAHSKGDLQSALHNDVNPVQYAPVVQHLVAWSEANCK